MRSFIFRFRREMMDKSFQILLTNDDGIQSPGLWAAAGALSELGYVHVVAPRDQFSGAGRSLPSTSDGIITPQQMHVGGKMWTVYSVGGTPAQAVLHAICEILPTRPDLVVSGINYGENLGVGITVSGTVGAAMEGAGNGIPSLAVSLETDQKDHLSYSTEIDFSTAAHFTQLFGNLMLNKVLPGDVDLLKVDVPCDATVDTPWEVTRLSKQLYFEPVTPKRTSWDQPETVGYRRVEQVDGGKLDTDVYTLRVKRLVSVTPLSLDMTSRIDLTDFDRSLRAG
jgi:5'-nucleotidase